MNRDLKVIHFFSDLLSRIFDFEELLEVMTKRISNHFNCERVSIVLIDDKGMPVLKLARGFSENGKLLKNKKLDTIGRITQLVLDKKKTICLNNENDWKREGLSVLDNDNYKTISFLATPIINSNEVKGIINVTEPKSKKSFTDADKHILEIIATQIGFSIETIKLHQKIVNQEVYKRELEIGRKLQLSLLPSSIIKSSVLDISYCSYPALLVGGDYYDFLRVDDEHLLVIIGDISGKGVAASQIMATIRTMLHTLFPKYIDDLSELMNELNRLLFKDFSDTYYYTTLFLALFDEKNKILTYINAGHNYPLFYDGSRVKELNRASTQFIGSFFNINPKTETLNLYKGNVLLLYSDGITESRNENDDVFGEKRLNKIFKKYASKGYSASHIRENIIADFKSFCGDRMPEDDYTLIVIKVRDE